MFRLDAFLLKILGRCHHQHMSYHQKAAELISLQRSPAAASLGGGGGGGGGDYLDVQVLVNFHRCSKEVDVLHQVCKLPHVPKLVECAQLRCWLWCRSLHLLAATLAGHHFCGGFTREDSQVRVQGWEVFEIM